MKRLSLFFLLMLSFSIIFVPLIFIDSGIIFFMDNSYSSTWNLIGFLLIFYFFDFLFGFVTDAFLTAIQALRRRPESFWLTFVVDTVTSFSIVVVLESFTSHVHLTTGTAFGIALAHSLLFYLVASSEVSLKSKKVKIDPHIAKEIQLLLKEVDVGTCIEILHEKYPHIPLQDLQKATLWIYNEMQKHNNLK